MKLAERFGHTYSKLKFKPHDTFVLPDCRVGLEWEWEQAMTLEDRMQQRKSHYLALKDDGSLRDHGREVVTQGDGLFGEDALAAITEMNELARECRPVCNYRTAFHVHIDVRDMEAQEIHNMLFLYCLVEQPIFNFVGKGRYDSNFCVPWGRADTMLEVLKGLQNPETIVTSKIKGLQRYSACNAQAIAKLGTIEFRHMENAIDELTTKQIAFINIVMSLKRLAMKLYAKGLQGPDLYNWAKRLTPRELLGHLAFDLPTDNWDYVEALTLGSRMIQFQKTTLDVFVDSLFLPFFGNHANWR